MTNLNWRTNAAFEKNFVYILDKHASKKSKILRENLKQPSQANDHWITSQKKANMSKNPSGIIKFKRQQNLVANLNK